MANNTVDMTTSEPLVVDDLQEKLKTLRWLHVGDAVVISIYNPLDGTTTNYPLTAVESDPRDPGVGIPTGALYLCGLTTMAEVQ
jgi:hypothetical protein